MGKRVWVAIAVIVVIAAGWWLLFAPTQRREDNGACDAQSGRPIGASAWEYQARGEPIPRCKPQ